MISINIYEILMQMVNFLILLWLLNKFVLKPLGAMLEKRQVTIKSDLEEANQNKRESETILNQQRDILKNAHHEAKEIRKKAQEAVNKERDLILNEAKTESIKIIDQAKKDIDQNVIAAKNELKNQIGTLALGLSAKIMKQTVDKDAQENLIKDYLELVKN